MSWILCNEKKPELHRTKWGDWSDYVLVASPKWKHVNVAQWWMPDNALYGEWIDQESGAPYSPVPTHWMPMPALPFTVNGVK